MNGEPETWRLVSSAAAFDTGTAWCEWRLTDLQEDCTPRSLSTLAGSHRASQDLGCVLLCKQ